MTRSAKLVSFLRYARAAAAVAAAVVAVALVAAPPASGSAGTNASPSESKGPFIPDADHDAHPPFAPQMSYSLSTERAGAHPDLKLRLTKVQPHCRGWYPSACRLEDYYQGEDLKKIAIHLPRGLMADANAAPYCDAEQAWMPMPDDTEVLRWRCKNPDAWVGEADVANMVCQPNGDNEQFPKVCIGEPHGLASAGDLYMERPGPGEQGHMVLLWPRYPEGSFPPESAYMTKTDVSVTVRAGDTVDTVGDNLPDSYSVPKRDSSGNIHADRMFVQPYDVEMTLFGSTGAASGHPLLTNATFCDPQSLDAEAQGYAKNAWPAKNEEGWDIAIPGSGDGTTVPFSFPYQATDCDQVPYNPNLSITLDNQGPDQAPAISSTVTQDPGEATTKSAKVVIPKAFKINVANKATHCSEADLAAKSCPEASRIGAVTAESQLLPVGQKLEGGVYLAGLTSDSVKVSAFLSGFVDLRIDASAALEADGSSVLTFDNLPAVPISKFDLNLEGGDKGLLKTPKICGPQAVSADFTSHSGKVKHATQALDIAGCNAPTLDAALSNRRAGGLTDLDLALTSPGKPISSVDLRLARQLHWGTRKHVKAKGKDRLSSAGAATFQTSAGERKVRLKAKTTKRGNLSFAGLMRKTKSGKRIAAAVPDFSASLFRTSGLSAKAKKKKKRGRRSAGRRSSLTFAGLPGDDLTRVELALRGKTKRRSLYIKNPTGCKRALRFTAIVTTTDGTTYAVKDKVRLRGKGCATKRK